jgi:hypothetical protein
MTKERVTYYSNYDGTIEMFRPRFIEVMDGPELLCGSLADALELYHVKRFVDNNLLRPSFSEDVWASYQAKAKTILGIIARYINGTPNDDLAKAYFDLNYSYLQSFWDVLEGVGQVSKLTEKDLEGILAKKQHSLQLLLRCKTIVKANNDFIREYMMASPESAEMVLAQRVECHEEDFRQYHLPEGLDTIALLSAYIDLEEPNSNYLRMILNARDDELRVPPVLKIRAKNKIRELYKKNESRLFGFSGHYGIEFSDKFTEVKALSVAEDGVQVLKYNSMFFLSKGDVDIISSLGPVFEYLDSDRLITMVNKDCEANVFEQHVMKAKSEYAPNLMFSYKAGVALSQLACLDNLLKADGRCIEKAIETYHNEYLKKAYGLTFTDISLLKDGEWKDRVKVLLPHFDSIVKQYDLFVEHGEVTQDLMKYSPGVPVTDAKSLLIKKYCQAVRDKVELNTIGYLLFSDQSLLSFVEPYKEKHYGSLYELMSKEDVAYESYKSFQKNRLDVLINQGYITVKENGTIVFSDLDIIDVLYALYHNGVCSFWRRPPEQRAFMLNLLEKGWATEDNHLLSKPERDYFSYYLNDRQFSDAESLRNRFLHGVSDEATANDYYRVLLLFILLLLKVEDDLRQNMALIQAAKAL